MSPYDVIYAQDNPKIYLPVIFWIKVQSFFLNFKAILFPHSCKSISVSQAS